MTPEQFDQRVKVFADAVKAEMFAQVAKPKQTEPWKPEMRETYFVVLSSGDVARLYWVNDDQDKAAWSVGNVFRTKAAAEREVERRKVIRELRVLAGGFKPDWRNDDQAKWFLYYNYRAEIWNSGHATVYQDKFTLPYFPTQKAAHNAITTLGIRRLDVLLDTTEE